MLFFEVYAADSISCAVQAMGVGQWILLALSRDPSAPDNPEGVRNASVEGALDLLTRVYPDFESIITGKRVLDFGSGHGAQSIALAREYDCTVVGVDTHRPRLESAIAAARQYDIPPEKLRFVPAVTPEMHGQFDIVLSQNSFEHFSQPVEILNSMTELLSPSGQLLITFGPPWFAPYGSHMLYFCKVPWLNILFPEKTVMKVRARFRNDGATRYEDIDSGLNKMSIRKFESIVRSCGLQLDYKNYECVKQIHGLAKLPLLRELFVNQVSVILSKP